MATIEARKNAAGKVTSYRVEWYDGGVRRRQTLPTEHAAAPYMLAGARDEDDEAWDSNRVAIAANPFKSFPERPTIDVVETLYTREQLAARIDYWMQQLEAATTWAQEREAP